MLKRPQFNSTAYTNYTENNELQSPYKTLEDSPTKRLQRPNLAIADQLRREHSNRKFQKQDFNQRLEEIKRKYTSPMKQPRLMSTPMTPIDMNLHTKRSIVGNQNKIKIKQDFTPLKSSNKYGSQIPRHPQSITRQPLQALTSSLQVPSQFSSNNEDHLKKIQEDKRVNSIDKINHKIKSILDGINYQNDKFCDRPKLTQSIDNKGIGIGLGFGSAMSARPEQSKDRRHLFTHGSLQKDSKDKQEINKSYLNSTLNKTQKKYTSRDFDNKMLDIQERIKKSQQNRLKAMQSLQSSKQASTIVPSTHTPVQQKQEQFIPKYQQCRQRSTTGAYSHRYIDFGKNKSRNILQELKQFGKQEIPETTRNKTEDFIPPSKNQMRKLINIFVEQVRLDEELRNARIWFQINNDQDKWTKLKQIICKRQRKTYSQQQIKTIFKCTQQDHNPFFVNQPNQSIQGITLKYLNSQAHWKNKVSKQFNQKILSEEGFKSEVLDLELKGYLQIQDIVRFLNIETGKFYRNRDLGLIFKRLSKTNKVSFEEFLRIICF